MAKSKRSRTADPDPPPTRKSPRLLASTQKATPSQAKSSRARTSARQAKSSRPAQSTSLRGKSAIIPTPTETPPVTTPDASDAGNSHGSSHTLTGRELAQAALKIVNNADSAEIMILELMDRYSFSLTRLKELLRGKLSQSHPFYHTKSLLGLTAD
jgi:hypothetical protein